MKNVTFKLTQFQLEEVQHKLSIVTNEPDLCDDYSLTEVEADDLEKLFHNARPGSFTVTNKQAIVIAGELENAADIWGDNGNTSAAHSLRTVMDAINEQLV